MWPRSRFYQYARSLAVAAGADEAEYISYLWMDHQFGALMDVLRANGVLDDTLVVLQSDHGQTAKGIHALNLSMLFRE